MSSLHHLSSEAPAEADLLHSVDPDGRKVVGVPLRVPPWMPPDSPRPIAWLYADDHEDVLAILGPARWRLERGSGRSKPFVRTIHRPGLPRTIARFITGNVPKTFVSYRDDNHLNLRRSNLILLKGHGGLPKVNRNRWNLSP